MKRIIIILIILGVIIKFNSICYTQINSSTSKFTNLNDKISYGFLKGVERYSRNNRIMGTIMFGVTSLGFFIGYQVADDSKIKFFIVYISTPFDICLKWNKLRGKPIPNKIIKKIYIGIGISSMMFLITVFTSRPSSSASGFNKIRWFMAGTTKALTSSGVTYTLPKIAALALEHFINTRDARGPHPRAI